MSRKPAAGLRYDTHKPKPIAPTPMTACSLEVDFDLLLGRARKAGILSSTQTYRLSDLLQREIGPRVEQELRLAAIAAERQEAERIAALPPKARTAARIMKLAQERADATV